MAVVSLFTFSSLTDGRTVRDLPRQHREKKNRTLPGGLVVVDLKIILESQDIRVVSGRS